MPLSSRPSVASMTAEWKMRPAKPKPITPQRMGLVTVPRSCFVEVGVGRALGEQHHGAAGDDDGLIHFSALELLVQIVRVHHALPVSITGAGWQFEFDAFMIGVNQDEEGIVHHGFAVRVLGIEGAPIQHEAETAPPGGAPRAWIQLRAAGLVPGDIADRRIVDGGALEEFPATEVVVLPAEMDQAAGEVDEQLLALTG